MPSPSSALAEHRRPVERRGEVEAGERRAGDHDGELAGLRNRQKVRFGDSAAVRCVDAGLVEAAVADDDRLPRLGGVHVGAWQCRLAAVGRVTEVDVEALQRDLVAAERVEHLARDAGDEQDVVTVGVDVEPGEVEGARVEAPARRIDVGAGAVVVAGRVTESAEASPDRPRRSTAPSLSRRRGSRPRR